MCACWGAHLVCVHAEVDIFICVHAEVNNSVCVHAEVNNLVCVHPKKVGNCLVGN